jgi:hypothetical protein
VKPKGDYSKGDFKGSYPSFWNPVPKISEAPQKKVPVTDVEQPTAKKNAQDKPEQFTAKRKAQE